MTNMINVHTCPASSPDLLVAVVGIMHGELVEVAGEMVHRPSVNIPISVNTVGVHGSSNTSFIRNVILIEPVPTINSRMAFPKANLAPHLAFASVASIVVLKPLLL
jgi:hypothetical protein